jgi:hypothetical protein
MKKLLILLLAAVLSTCGDSTNNDIDIPCKDTDCRDYFSQASAQAAFNADRNCRNDLDQDKDGTACEEPGNEVSSLGLVVVAPVVEVLEAAQLQEHVDVQERIKRRAKTIHVANGQPERDVVVSDFRQTRAVPCLFYAKVQLMFKV